MLISQHTLTLGVHRVGPIYFGQTFFQEQRPLEKLRVYCNIFLGAFSFIKRFDVDVVTSKECQFIFAEVEKMTNAN